jgi:hypothetical protein
MSTVRGGGAFGSKKKIEKKVGRLFAILFFSAVWKKGSENGSIDLE